MTAALLVAHVLAAVVFVGPITVAASSFPRYVRAAVDRTASTTPGQPDAATISAAAPYRAVDSGGLIMERSATRPK